MPIPTGGFAGVDVGFQPLPQGVYTVEVTDGELRKAGEEAKNPNSEYIAWEFTVQEDDDHGDEFEGRKVWTNSSLVEKARPALKEFLVGVGYTVEELDDPDFELDIEEIVGRRCKVMVTVGNNPKTKQPNNSVRRTLPLDSDEAALPS